MGKREEFKVTVKEVKSYKIELDEEVFTEEWMAKFREVFYDYYTLEEHAEHIAYNLAVNDRKFMEGYGYPLINGKIPYWVPKDRSNHVNKGINVITVYDNVYVDVK